MAGFVNPRGRSVVETGWAPVAQISTLAVVVGSNVLVVGGADVEVGLDGIPSNMQS